MAGNCKKKNKWISENLDRINLTVEKGKKGVLKTYAENNGESLNGFINRAIDHLIDYEVNSKSDTIKVVGGNR